ncbi:hypothetical protein LTR78_008371 [Recurvomyces mirabilis]|uniref:Delta 8-(E)-sphingolipid desaturase n=1 Tax=Recurvomyces mirabilis TaxID=574656 RepID=A0AAE0TQW2_9PEZI|nr:hypothetical protein LTR78_008371 [Recurvomyces mirabilis]KAK5158502.1 hypothetical protein LTS14_003522 [Recurvomyces mirabilis]
MAALHTTSPYRECILTRNDIEALIAEGRKIVILDGKVIKPDAWLPYHPGGDKAILHMVGRDATNEVKAFHSRETQDFMLKYQIGRIEGPWVDFLPPIQGGVFRTKDMQGAEDGRSSAERDSSDRDSSVELSPIFDATESSSYLRRRKSNGAANDDSSATSLSDMELKEPTQTSKKANNDNHPELLYDLDAYPDLNPTTQANINQKYKLLDARLRAQNLYACNYTAYFYELLRYTLLALLAYSCLQTHHYIPSALFLGMLWHQLTFTVHDAGHMGITHSFHLDSLLSILVADFLGGLSACWWKQNHNVHHIVTNSAEHDPDIQHMPFFAISPRFFGSLRSTYYDRIMAFDSVAKFTLKYQHYLYYPILCFGRFNLYVLSWQYIILGQGPRKGPARYHRYLEMLGQVFFWYWFGYLVVYRSIPTAWERILYIAISHAVTMPVHVQITLSHFAMSTVDLGPAESFPQKMLRTTMDVDCPCWLDWFHGGLQFQAVHHLFPRMPRHNLRRAQGFVREFCEDVGIPYAIFGFVEGNGKVIGRLGEVAKQARMLAGCQRSITVGEVLDGH